MSDAERIAQLERRVEDLETAVRQLLDEADDDPLRRSHAAFQARVRAHEGRTP